METSMYMLALYIITSLDNDEQDILLWQRLASCPILLYLMESSKYMIALYWLILDGLISDLINIGNDM
jgi:hypothetical protein